MEITEQNSPHQELIKLANDIIERAYRGELSKELERSLILGMERIRAESVIPQ